MSQASNEKVPRPFDIRNVADHLPVLISYVDKDLRYQAANATYRAWFGWDPKDMIGRKIEDLIGAGPAKIGLPALKRALQGEKVTLRSEMPYNSGGKRYVEAIYTPDIDDKGDVKGLHIIVSDISDRMTNQRALEESEAYFRNIVDNSPALVWMTDSESKCTYLSRQWYQYTGRTPEQDLGLGWLENIHPEDLPNTSNIYANAVEAKGLLSIEYRLRRYDGQYRWMIDLGHPRLNDQGQFIGYVGTVTDIHDRVEAEKRYRDVNERFARATKAVQLGVWYCDLPFQELLWDEVVRRHFFIEDDRPITLKDFYGFLHPDDRTRTKEAVEKSIFQHLPYDIHYRTVNPKDPKQIRWIRAVGWTDYDLSGNPIRFDGITLDVTEEMVRSQELIIAKDEAERANQLKSTFLANMSHEIRTPLGAMLGFSELLRDTELTLSQKEAYLNILIRNGENLNVIINDILDLSKVEAGHLNLEYAPLRPFEIAEDVISLLQIKAQEKGLQLKLTCEATSPPKFISDPIRIRQILMNVIGNAVKFTNRGHIQVRIFGSAAGDPRTQLFFEVLDTGIGIAPSQRERIFEMFVQADGSTTRQFGGTGLGLALSRKLARALGGDITLTDSNPDVGTRFLISIADLSERIQLQDSHNEKLIQDNNTKSINLQGVRVLVVDDAPDNRQLISHYLSKQGLIVEPAENGAVAIEKALSRPYDIVLMDLQMPVMDGYTATTQLRKAGFKRPIIALTAHAMTEVRDKVLMAGANIHLAKPINFKELVATICSQLKG